MSDDNDEKKPPNPRNLKVLHFDEEEEVPTESVGIPSIFDIRERICGLASSVFVDMNNFYEDEEPSDDIVNTGYEIMKQITGKLCWFFPADGVIREDDNNIIMAETHAFNNDLRDTLMLNAGMYYAIDEFLKAQNNDKGGRFWRIQRWRSVFSSDDPSVCASEFLFVLCADVLNYQTTQRDLLKSQLTKLNGETHD